MAYHAATAAQAAAAAAQQSRAAATNNAQQNNSNNNNNNNKKKKKVHQSQSQGDPSGLVQIRNEINMLLSKGKYEEAFTKAVATTTATAPQIAVYCCARLFRSRQGVLLSGNNALPPLSQSSQPILICFVLFCFVLFCLMQQLIAALAGTH